ncbi:MAG: methyltransferase domain-containing protein, partial [Rhodothermales bacterium]|nr:methyltransferase domain-containing protein [Rhodothermales bacterium]
QADEIVEHAKAEAERAGEKAKADLKEHLRAMDLRGAREVVQELVQLRIWNKVHLVEDAVWDPRGKRALFEGLDVERPEVLFLGAADGYEAMQLAAMCPGGHAVLVDYDDFCRTDRFGTFPERYPFLGRDPATGYYRVYHREDFDIDFEVADIRDLKYGKEFDVVVSIGLIEHFPDGHKAEVFDFHRRFLKPGGVAVMTTPRKQVRSKLFYLALGEIMNYGYRELMDARQLGLYAYENGFEVLRAGTIKAHNGVICKAR